MPKQVRSHLRQPMESRLGMFDLVPFCISRDEERMEVGIAPAEKMASGLHLEDGVLFCCTVYSASSQAMPGEPFNVAASSLGVLKLRIDRALLNTSDRIAAPAAGSASIRVDDPVVGELAIAVMNHLPVDSRNSYTATCMTKMLCARLVQLKAGDDPTNTCAFEDWQLSALMETLDESTEECASVAEIARRCRLSVCHFSRLFKATFGMPLHRYRVNERINEAKSRLVDSNDPISQIALDCGFADQSSFTRRFTAIAGVSPGLWRRKAEARPCIAKVRVPDFTRTQLRGAQ
jgi:AraC-like DNA-binding protein